MLKKLAIRLAPFAATGALVMGTVGNASAALDPGFSTAVTGAATDGAAGAALVLLVFVAIKAVKWIRGAL